MDFTVTVGCKSTDLVLQSNITHGRLMFSSFPDISPKTVTVDSQRVLLDFSCVYTACPLAVRCPLCALWLWFVP